MKSVFEICNQIHASYIFKQIEMVGEKYTNTGKEKI